MKIYLSGAVALVAACAANPSLAQDAAQVAPTTEAVAPAVPVPPATLIITRPDANIVPRGTKIRLRTLSELSSKKSKVGDRFDLEVAEDVMIGGRVVIPRGTSAVGDVTLVKKKGMWGKSGKLEARVLYLRVNGVDVPVHGSVGDKGETGTAGVVASIAVLPVAGFFVTGTSAIMPAGTGANAELETDLPFRFDDRAS